MPLAASPAMGALLRVHLNNLVPQHCQRLLV
jgi:hypothetical protein